MNNNLKQEALSRMKKLGLMPQCIRAFEKNNEIWASEYCGILYDLSNKKELLKQIRDIEKQYNILVYHCVITPTDFGVLNTLFYVSSDEYEWSLDNKDIDEGYACCYCINSSDDSCSEFGSIEFKKINGGLIRTA